MHIALCGPCSPSGVRTHLAPEDAIRADSFPGIGGVPVFELANGLLEAGHRVTVITTTGVSSTQTASFRGDGIEVVVVATRPSGRAIKDLYRVERRSMSTVLRDIRPDIVHAHWTYEFELAAQDSGLPHVTTAHDAPFTILRHMRDPYRAARLAVALRARPGIEHMSAISPYMAMRWRRQMRYHAPIAVIPNSIPTFSNAQPRRPSAHPTVLEVADAGRGKNVRGLLRAFTLVRQEVPQAEIRLVGPGLGPHEPLARWAGSHGVATGVSFLGPMGRAELADEYSRAWVFAHASLEESFGLTVLEALASGVPVLGGRNSGGVPFVLGYGRAGWLTDVTDAQSFARDLAAMICGGPRIPPPGADLYIQENFTPEAVAAQYSGWYQSTLEEGSAG